MGISNIIPARSKPRTVRIALGQNLFLAAKTTRKSFAACPGLETA
jgi:hypothetical protein